MARLNEPAIPTETVEALKRRFMRQNRDLAKTNSLQSIRIRCLEAEVSRLLAENLELREEVLRAQKNFELHPVPSALLSIKDRLGSKIEELSSLLSELGDMQGASRTIAQRPRAPTARPERNTEVLQEQEDRMPTIAEDKQWPRLSLESEEIQKLGDATDSPDPQQHPLGVYRDAPIRLAHMAEAPPADDARPDGGMLPESLAVNLEPRRRRRESVRAHGKKVMDFAESPDRAQPAPAEQKAAAAAVRAGAKRKLSVRDDSDSDAPAEQGRKALAQDVDDQAERVLKEREGVRGAKLAVAMARARQERRALESKPVNTDPIVSPKKVARHAKPLKAAVAEINLSGSEKPSRTKPRELLTSKPEAPPKTNTFASLIDDQPSRAPETPAAIDMLSPPSQPSTERQTGRDTPPPAGFTSLSAMAAAEPNGRATRRARTAVNYAEPSLISKMRRPTKELLDAVGRDGRPLKGTIVGREARREAAAEWKPSSAVLGVDDARGAAEEPPSPLGARGAPSKAEEEEGEEEEAVVVCETVARTAASRRSTTAGGGAVKPAKVEPVAKAPKQAKSAAPPPPPPPADARPSAAVREDDLAIFDFTDSSPNELRAQVGSSAAAAARRRTTMSEDKDGAGAAAGAKKASRTSGGARRRSMMV